MDTTARRDEEETTPAEPAPAASADTPAGVPEHRPRQPDRLISPITRRILAVNVLALGILVGGLLYLGEYRDSLIESELGSLEDQAEMFAAALGEGAVGGESIAQQELIRETANRIVRRMVETTDTRARLFRADGRLVADSRELLQAGRDVQVEELPPPDSGPGALKTLLDIYDRAARWMPWHDPLPVYHEQPRQQAYDYAEAIRALAGQPARAVRSLDQDRMLLSVAVPVQRYKQVLGALMVSTDSSSIDAALYQVRIDILKIFLIALTVTILLSFYLAGTIARPINRLARAADRIRRSHSRQHRLPEMTGRDDEIGDLAAALTDMTDALWQRMDAIESFAADVSHEIKNPLSSLRSAVETAARIQDTEQQKKLMAIILEDVQRLDRLISDISNASRLDAELSRGQTGPVDVGRMLGTLVDLHRSTAEEGSPRIVLDVAAGDDEALVVDGMEDRLVQVFRNLIANAVTFSPPGGTITVAAHREDGRGGAVAVVVEDEGPGIPPGSEQAIFDRFYTQRPESEKFGTHSGLGLSISRQIVEAHGGTIVAENRTGEDGAVTGARFTVRLPLAA